MMFHCCQGNFVTLMFSFLTSVSLVSSSQVNVTQFNSCSCDMRSRFCDVNCCCDEECTELQMKSFSCSKTKQLARPISYGLCRDIEDGPQMGFAEFLCLYKENSPFLGYYFRDIQIVRDLPSLNDLIATVSNKGSDESRFAGAEGNTRRTDSSTGAGYIFEQDLSIIMKHLHTSMLQVPYSIYGHMCDVLRPVQYLRDFSSFCLRRIGDCPLPQMNAESYLLNSEGQKLLGAPEDEFALQNVTAAYFYSENSCCYLHDSKCMEEDCTVYPYPYAQNISRMVQKTCLDAVVDVKYEFFWKGGRIYSAHVQVILANVSSSMFYQKFSVSFRHIADNSSTYDESYTRKYVHNTSLGYKIGDKVLGYFHDIAIDDQDITGSNTSFVQTYLYLWHGGTCSVGSNPALFGRNRFAGCTLMVHSWDDVECSELLEKVKEMQKSVLNADLLSKRGEDDGTDFLEITEEEVSWDNSSDEASSILGGCRSIPYHVSLDVTYAEVARLRGEPLYEILESVRRYYTITVYPDSKGVSVYPILSSVHFNRISLEELEKRLRTKRSALPESSVRHCAEETCWRDIFYPLASSDFFGERLSQAFDAMFVICILLASCAFLFFSR